MAAKRVHVNRPVPKLRYNNLNKKRAALMQLNFLSDEEPVYGELSLRNGEFAGLRVGSVSYTRVVPHCDDGLRWEYLANAEAFARDLEGTPWTALRYMRRSRVAGRREGGLRVQVVVNSPESSVFGRTEKIRMVRRVFNLEFWVDEPGNKSGVKQCGERRPAAKRGTPA